MKELQRELRRGTMDLVLLRLLADRPAHGYELVRRLGSKSGGDFEVKEGTLYPVLYRLEDAGLIVPEWTQPEAGERGGRGVPRKIYRLTEAGEKRLEELVAAWRSFERSVDVLLEPPAAEEEA